MAGYQRKQQTTLENKTHSVETVPDDVPDDAMYFHVIVHLIHVGQMLTGQPPGEGARLAGALAAITWNRAQLLFSSHGAGSGQLPLMDVIFLSFPIRCGTRTYGMLAIAPDTERPDLPAIPLAVAHLLAELCGLLLHNLEQSALLEAQKRNLGERPAPEPLTVREHEILTLICQGHNEADIATTLTISPATVGKHRQHIYDKLGIHNEHEARLMASYRFSRR